MTINHVLLKLPAQTNSQPAETPQAAKKPSGENGFAKEMAQAEAKTAPQSKNPQKTSTEQTSSEVSASSEPVPSTPASDGKEAIQPENITAAAFNPGALLVDDRGQGLVTASAAHAIQALQPENAAGSLNRSLHAQGMPFQIPPEAVKAANDGLIPADQLGMTAATNPNQKAAVIPQQAIAAGSQSSLNDDIELAGLQHQPVKTEGKISVAAELTDQADVIARDGQTSLTQNTGNNGQSGSQQNSANNLQQLAGLKPTGLEQAVDKTGNPEFNNELQLASGTSSTTPASGQSTGSTAVNNAWLQQPVTSNQWGSDFGRQILSLTQKGNQRVALHLNPENLGPVMVDIKVSEQTAQIQFAAMNQQIRNIIENAIPQLREVLEEQGITLSEATVDDQQREQASFDDNPRSRGQSGESLDEHDAITVAAQTRPASRNIALDGGVNVYV